jgi:uncharacterized tellurite resistance protein B-like protein
MIDAFKKFFERALMPDPQSDDKTPGIQYATAALLIEMARADFDADDLERALIMAMLRDTFDLDEDLLAELVRLAETGAEEAVDVYQFTQLVNEHYSFDDKTQLIRNLWRVAYADGRLDRYEEQFLRKVAGLLHIPHADFIKAKLEVLASLEGGAS